MNATSVREDAGAISGSDPVLLLWLWLRRAATALIPPQAWELPYAAGAALKKKKKKKNKRNLKRIFSDLNQVRAGPALHGTFALALPTSTT